MRKLIISEFLSLDGVFEGPGPDDPFVKAGWTMPYANDEFMKFKADELFAADALLLGRITYEGFAKAWPNRKDETGFADKMNNMKKYVASTTLNYLDWKNSQVLGSDLVQEITNLKQEPGKDILVFGSGTLSQVLIKSNLVDEYRFLVYPVVLGEGKKFFKEGISTQLNLEEIWPFKTGIVLLRYSWSQNNVQ